ncbi:MAG: hypothetical protein HY761_03015 [Candidatus Omnitrophica bacterium]|nr:hypothetical protein [Candidatus Omnitrophota bacterium]
MRIITFVFVIIILVLSALLWNSALDTRFLSRQAKNTSERISAVKQEKDALLKYKSQASLPLEKFYLEVFNDIKELSFYYRAASEVKIIEAKELVNIQTFFKESQYKGIKYVDVLCRVDLKNQFDTYLFDTLYKMLKDRPIEVLEASLEKNILNLTMRLYGP